MRFGDLATFLAKMNVPENFCFESLGPIGNEILENVPEPLAILRIFRFEDPYK